MFARRHILGLLPPVGAMALVACALPALAKDFRVESKVYAGSEQAPVTESVSLFHQGKVYDFLSSPAEVTVFDVPRGRILMLDSERGVQAELTVDQLVRFGETVRARASTQLDPLLKFAANPKFEMSQDDGDWLVFASPELTYRVRPVKAESAAVATAYREFADCSARLNTITRPGAVPPFPRLAINAALARDQRLPVEVEMIPAEHNRRGGRASVMRSEHQIGMDLSSTDRERIEETEKSLATFKPLPLDEYLQPTVHPKP